MLWGQIKAFSFLFCTACDAKSTKYGERWYTEWLQSNMQKEQRAMEKYKKIESVNTQND